MAPKREDLDRALNEKDRNKRRQILKDVWAEEARKALKGRRRVGVRYTTAAEEEELMWHSAGIVLMLDNGHLLYPAKDDEGNQAGALHTTFDKLKCVPTI